MADITILPITTEDKKWIAQFMLEHGGSNRVVSRGVIYYPQDLPGFVALLNGEKVGLITYNIIEESCEIITINSTYPASGVGTALIKAIKDTAIKSGCKRLWLI